MTDTILSTAHRDEHNQTTLPLDAFAGEHGTERLAGVLEALALVADDGLELEAVAEVTATSVERATPGIRTASGTRTSGVYATLPCVSGIRGSFSSDSP